MSKHVMKKRVSACTSHYQVFSQPKHRARGKSNSHCLSQPRSGLPSPQPFGVGPRKFILGFSFAFKRSPLPPGAFDLRKRRQKKHRQGLGLMSSTLWVLRESSSEKDDTRPLESLSLMNLHGKTLNAGWMDIKFDKSPRSQDSKADVDES